MSLVLEDGPAKGRYSVRRAPHFLRAVTGANGHRDILDQLGDEPFLSEVVHVYEAVRPTWSAEASRRSGVIVCPPPGASGTYRHRADVDGEQLRTSTDWRAWCRAQPVDVELYDPAPEVVSA